MSAKPAPTQTNLTLVTEDPVDVCFRRVMRALEDAQEAAGGNLVVAGATGIDKSDLSKMFDPGSGRHMRLKALPQIAALRTTSMELRRRILEPLAELLGFHVLEGEPMTDKERADVGEAVIAALGPIAVDAYNRALKGRR